MYRVHVQGRVGGCGRALRTETKVESGTSQSKSGTSVNLRSNSGEQENSLSGDPPSSTRGYPCEQIHKLIIGLLPRKHAKSQHLITFPYGHPYGNVIISPQILKCPFILFAWIASCGWGINISSHSVSDRPPASDQAAVTETDPPPSWEINNSVSVAGRQPAITCCDRDTRRVSVAATRRLTAPILTRPNSQLALHRGTNQVGRAGAAREYPLCGGATHRWHLVKMSTLAFFN
ncbi:hypothetical protein T484DRAFT_3257695 [Baffinella frigidus]|nr:hypothetical protein T484DRAFT_3257695 [Cryptophyta sp. CCMP2293]